MGYDFGLGNLFGTQDSNVRANDPAFGNYLAENSMTFDDYNALSISDPEGAAALGKGFMDQYNPGSSAGGFGDMGFKDQASFGLGVGQLGLGVAGYLDNKKTAELQRENLGTQIDSNKDLLATRKSRAGDITSAFG